MKARLYFRTAGERFRKILKVIEQPKIILETVSTYYKPRDAYQHLHTGRLHKQISRIQVRRFYTFDALHVDVENADSTLLLDILHRFLAERNQLL